MGEHDEDQEHGAEPARPPLTTAQAREMTAGLREAMDDVRRSVAALAARVRDAHAARVWVPLGHSSWESYCAAEFGISRAQAYRLLDVARSLAAIHGAVAAGTELSRTRDSDPAAAAALDYGLSQRALIAVSSRAEDVAELITRRLATLAHSGLQALDTATVRAVVRQADRDVRPAPPRVPAGPARPSLAPLPAAPRPVPGSRRRPPLWSRAWLPSTAPPRSAAGPASAVYPAVRTRPPAPPAPAPAAPSGPTPAPCRAAPPPRAAPAWCLVGSSGSSWGPRRTLSSRFPRARPRASPEPGRSRPPVAESRPCCVRRRAVYTPAQADPAQADLA
ncbi:hypothetical protein [Streptomyces filamentosus]|uniref:hypothetical protein n=1 Tax=Streptomyces filamentosus TaxID=67294 RepID=UPI001E569C5B|nr:hypothetical protein [Streptomyces filamentosus]